MFLSCESCKFFIFTVAKITLFFNLVIAAATALSAFVDVSVRDFGAKGDGVTKDTAAIQRAIDACAAKGGGRVVMERGVYLSAPIFMKSGVELYLEKDATLLGSADLADYPNVPMEHIAYPLNPPRARCTGLIIADEAHDIAITGFSFENVTGCGAVRRVCAAIK